MIGVQNTFTEDITLWKFAVDCQCQIFIDVEVV